MFQGVKWLTVVGADDVGLDMSMFEERENTLEGNSIKKAEYAFNRTGLLSLADDSGMFVKSLPDILGVKSARYLGEDTSYDKKVESILKLLSKHDDRSAKMSTSIAIVGRNFKDSVLHESEGSISFEVLGDVGFDYDKIFIPEGESKTYSQLGLKYKSDNSARALATKDIINKIIEKEEIIQH